MLRVFVWAIDAAENGKQNNPMKVCLLLLHFLRTK